MKRKNLYWFNIGLGVVAIFAAASSVQLEVASGRDFGGISFVGWTWVHIVVCLAFMFAVGIHLCLHWGGVEHWFTRTKRLRSKQTRWLVWLSAITLVSGIVSAILFLVAPQHNVVGIVHGKFGLVVIVISILHFAKRFSWFRGRRS